MGFSRVAARSAGRCFTAPVAPGAENNAQTSGLWVQSISPGLPKAFGIHGATGYGMGNARQGSVPCHRKVTLVRWRCRVTLRAHGLQSEHRQPWKNLKWHEQWGNSAWVEMHNINCIISVETLFKASKSSSKQEDWKGWNAEFLWERNCNLSNPAVVSVQTVPCKIWFPNTCGSSCLRLQGAQQFGLSALPCDQHRIKQAQCRAPDSVFLLKSLSQTSLLRVASH